MQLIRISLLFYFFVLIFWILLETKYSDTTLIGRSYIEKSKLLLMILIESTFYYCFIPLIIIFSTWDNILGFFIVLILLAINLYISNFKVYYNAFSARLDNIRNTIPQKTRSVIIAINALTINRFNTSTEIKLLVSLISSSLYLLVKSKSKSYVKRSTKLFQVIISIPLFYSCFGNTITLVNIL